MNMHAVKIPGNVHADGAMQFASWARNGNARDTNSDHTAAASAFREYSLIQATLAVAYEQRTANLITWATANGSEPNTSLAADIVARLGLEKS